MLAMHGAPRERKETGAYIGEPSSRRDRTRNAHRGRPPSTVATRRPLVPASTAHQHSPECPRILKPSASKRPYHFPLRRWRVSAVPRLARTLPGP